MSAMARRVGIDLVSIDSVAHAVETQGERYLARIFTERERRDCGDAPRRLAGCFAAKEATMKVLRPEPGQALPWTSIEVGRRPGGGADLRLAGAAAELARASALDGFALGLSDGKTLASAIVVANTRDRCR